MAAPPDGSVLGPLADDLAVAALLLARRFAAGGTLWCWSPGQPAHAHHVAVEFVHPVVMGTRALPAAVVTATDAAAELRPVARPGDVLLAVAPDDPDVAATLRRATAWGLATLWLGDGPRPPAGAADGVLWLGTGDGPDALAGHDGRFVLAYHLLWELTHVCFEHPGLLVEEPACEGPACTTCSDEGRLGEVVGAEGTSATVRTATGLEPVDTTIVGAVGPGDLVLVHAGTAIAVVGAGG
ncbi:MAG TPA: hypothetical protein VGB14_17020 [Acidimicrobiales bacterium]|jgi:hypothetical protein